MEKLFNHLAFMPRGPIPEQNDGAVGVSRQKLFQMLHRNRSIHLLAAQDNLLAGMQVQRAIEIHFIPLRIRTDQRGLPTGSPDGLEGRLEVERGFILRQIDRIRRVLRVIYYFFFDQLVEGGDLFLIMRLVDLSGALIAKPTLSEQFGDGSYMQLMELSNGKVLLSLPILARVDNDDLVFLMPMEPFKRNFRQTAATWHSLALGASPSIRKGGRLE
jgi:hypothetical protein